MRVSAYKAWLWLFSFWTRREVFGKEKAKRNGDCLLLTPAALTGAVLVLVLRRFAPKFLFFRIKGLRPYRLKIDMILIENLPSLGEGVWGRRYFPNASDGSAATGRTNQ